MSFQPADKAMLEGYIKVARPLEDMFSVKGKVALVPGGSSGLGFDICVCSRAAPRWSSPPTPKWKRKQPWIC